MNKEIQYIKEIFKNKPLLERKWLSQYFLEENYLKHISTQNTTEDSHLDKIEREANLKGTMTFRNWTDTVNKLKINEILDEEIRYWALYANLFDDLNNKNYKEIYEKLNKILKGEKLNALNYFYNTYFKNNPDLINVNEFSNSKDPFGITSYALELAKGLEEQKEPKYKIYVDMDGVLVDFDGGYEKLTGITTQEADKKGPESFWEPVSKAGAKWWITLKWMPGGKQLWNYVKKYNPELLSAPSKEEASKLGKRVWVKRELPGVKLILRPADRKQEFASPNSILIDDREKNIEQWKNAGGVGILHTSTLNTIEQLKDLGI